MKIANAVDVGHVDVEFEVRMRETSWARRSTRARVRNSPTPSSRGQPRARPSQPRELLYTALTRGKERLTVVASEGALRAAVSHPVARASGLRERLWPAGPEGDA
jgi:hypothetical protein